MFLWHLLHSGVAQGARHSCSRPGRSRRSRLQPGRTGGVPGGLRRPYSGKVRLAPCWMPVSAWGIGLKIQEGGDQDQNPAQACQALARVPHNGEVLFFCLFVFNYIVHAEFIRDCNPSAEQSKGNATPWISIYVPCSLLLPSCHRAVLCTGTMHYALCSKYHDSPPVESHFSLNSLARWPCPRPWPERVEQNLGFISISEAPVVPVVQVLLDLAHSFGNTGRSSLWLAVYHMIFPFFFFPSRPV